MLDILRESLSIELSFLKCLAIVGLSRFHSGNEFFIFGTLSSHNRISSLLLEHQHYEGKFSKEETILEFIAVLIAPKFSFTFETAYVLFFF